MKRQFLALIALLWTTALCGEPAWSHAVLLETIPADRAVLAQSPNEILLRFNEAVQPVALRIIDGAGKQVASDARTEVRDGDLRILLAAPLAPGAYVLSYRITSEDSHPVGGSYLFAIGDEPAAWRPPAVAAASPVWATANGVNRALHLAGLLTLAGGVLFLLLFPSERLANRRALAPLLTGCAALAALTAILSFGLQGGMLADAAAADILRPALWRLGFGSTRGTAALLALASVALLLLAIKLGTDKRAQRLFPSVAVAALSFCAAAFVVSGHVATAQPRWLTMPALLFHVAIAATWLGSFAPLLRSLERDNKGTLPTIMRFSRGMSIGLPILILAGLAISAVQLRSFDALATSRYGALLTLKLLLVAGLIAIAAYNKFQLTPQLRTRPSAKSALRRTICWEICLGLAILAVTAFLSQTMPPRSAGQHAEHDHAAPLAGYSTVTMSRGRMAFINVDPAVAGRNRLDIRLSAGDGRPLASLEASVELRHDMAGIEPIQRRLEKLDNGHYRLSGPDFAVSGAWSLTINVLISDYEQISFAAAIPIAR
jgi:copper transport protein